MTSVLNVDTIAAKDGTSAATLTKQSAAKAFAQVEADGSAVLTSLNTSSWTDEGTGDGIQNLTNAFSSANYSAIASAHCDLGSSLGGIGAVNSLNSASAIEYRGTNASGARTDPNNDYNLSTFGDLA
tara:strand:+ start:73 stop:453 length:381 start_codon:yes stop_codon:yes gene_type:complete